MFQDMINTIEQGREWSWSIVGVLAIVSGLIIRSVLLRDILRGMKIRNRTWYRRTQTYYQKRGLVGWIFFALFAIGAMLLWRFEAFFLNYLNLLQWILVLSIFLILSIFSHLRAYACAIVEAVEENVAADKDI